jgi:molybdopterin-guanine dinucleotide biosynthesis protein A
MDERDAGATTPPLVAVLAGGLGRRIGGAKARAGLAGRPLISHPLQAAADAGLRAVVVAKPDSELPPLHVPVVYEPQTPRHPLCGVLAALRHAATAEQRAGGATGRSVLAVACDMPFVSGALLALLAGLGEPALAIVDGRRQPLPALYLASDAPALRRALQRGDSLRTTLATLDARTLAERELREVGNPRRLFFSVNDASDLQLAQEWVDEGRH